MTFTEGAWWISFLVIPVWMNQRNSTIDLSSSFQPEIRQGRVAGKNFKKIRQRPDCLLIRAILMVKKYIHENLKRIVAKPLAKRKYSHFQTITANNSKHVSDFVSNNTDTLMELLPNNTTHFSRHQTMLTFSESYWETILQSLYQAILTFLENSFQIKLYIVWVHIT